MIFFPLKYFEIIIFSRQKLFQTIFCSAIFSKFKFEIGVRFAESSSSSSSSSSSDQSLSQVEDGAGVGGRSLRWEDSEDSSTLLCSMVDKATLNKLTKEDLLLLWQAAESEWLAKVRALRKQRDILQLRYQHAKVTSQVQPAAQPAPPYQLPPTPPPAPTMKF